MIKILLRLSSSNYNLSLGHIDTLKMNSTATTPFLNNKKEKQLFRYQIPIKTKKNEVASIDFVYQDTGSNLTRGTVFAMHGAPGSHNDFKYITPLLTRAGVRTIAINFPGLGYSSYDDRLQNTNEERAHLLQSLLNKLELKNSPLIFMGHSRGAEDALRMAAANKDNTLALVNLNMVGFRPHRGIRPFWITKLLAAIWNFSVYLQPILSPLYYYIYSKLGLKLANGKMAGICVSLVANCDFGKQKEFINILNNCPWIRVLLAYSGKDYLIEEEFSHELADSFSDMKQLKCEKNSDDDGIINKAKQEIMAGRKSLGVFFENEGHFLQKHRAKFIAESILAILEMQKSKI